MTPVSLDLCVDQDELATQIANSLEPEEVIELIKKIDLEIAEWEFTTTLAGYLQDELAKLHQGEEF